MVLSVFAYAPAATEASTAGITLTVDQSFNDNNEDTDGDNKFVTIQAAVNNANPGDTIEVNPGTYNENVQVDVGDLTVLGSGASSTTISGSAGSPTLTLGADNIEFRDFRVEAPSQGSNPAIQILDLQGSWVKDVHVEDNVFVGNDNTSALAYATPPSGPSQARELTIVNNEFTGGTPGSMQFGLWFDGTQSTLEGNVFSVSASRASLAVSGPDNTIVDTTINYPGYGFTGMAISPNATGTTVDTLSVDGHPDSHLHEDPTRGDWLKNGVYVAGNGSSLSNVDVVQTHIGIHVASAAFSQSPAISGVTIADSTADQNRNHDLEIENADGITVNNFDAMSDVRPIEDEWSNWNFGPHPSSGVNVYVQGGSGHTLNGVTSHSATPIGIRLAGVDSSQVTNADIANKGGAQADLDGDGVGESATTGISLNDSDDNTVSNSLVTDNDVGVSITDGDNNALVGNNPGIYNNTNEGVLLQNADDTTLSDNDVRDNGVGLHATLDSDDVRAKYNNFVGNGQGVVADATSDVDATWNWFGADNGPSGPATDGVLSGSGDSISGAVDYDPFLTAAKDQVQQDPDKTKQYAHDLVTNGSQGIQTVGTPGPAEVSFQFSTGANAGVWTYESGSFDQVTSPTEQADTLEAYLISSLDHGEHARVVVDFSDATPSTPGAKSLDDGWNFVTAPQYGATENVVVTNTDVKRVHHGYTQFDSQPAPSGAPTPATSAFSYAIGSNSPGPNLSAYSGYWVYVNGDGEITAAIPAGVTITEEEGLIVA